MNTDQLIQNNTSHTNKIQCLIEIQYWEKIGKYYFAEAIDCLIQNKFDEAFENIICGYNYVTCDCTNGDWFNEKEVEDIFFVASKFDCLAFKFEFLKAFVFYYIDKSLASLNSINCFIDLQPTNEIGFYLKGKILLKLEKYSEALENFEKALKIKNTSRTLYRIGRTKEEYLESIGLSELYKAIKQNPSSGDAQRHFAFFAMKREAFPQDLKNYKNSYHANEFICALKLGIAIEKSFAEEGIKGIFDYMNKIYECLILK
jgi:tetratricopeptide (TPR) repeat protein